jgi:phage-related protein
MYNHMALDQFLYSHTQYKKILQTSPSSKQNVIPTDRNVSSQDWWKKRKKMSKTPCTTSAD